MLDDFGDDDDRPLVFKRGNTFKQNQLNSEIKKSSSQRQDVSNAHSLNGQNSSVQKGKTFLSPNASPMKSHAASPKASTSSGKVLSAKSPVSDSQASTSLGNQLKHSSKQITLNAVEEDHSTKHPNEPNRNDEDSEDDKPLSCRIKSNSHHVSNDLILPPAGSSLSPITKISVKESSEDTDDDKPLVSRLQAKSNVGKSDSKLSDHDEKNLLALKPQQNGSTVRNIKQISSSVSSKRPLISTNQSSVKKVKLMGSSTTVKVEQHSSKAGCNDEDFEYNKPQSSRTILKTNHANKVPASSPPGSSSTPKSKINTKESSEDTDDEKPLVSRLQQKLGSKLCDNDERKPLASKHQQTGSTVNNVQEKSSSVLSKRPLMSSNPSSVKKGNLSESSVPVKIEPRSLKAELKAEDDDDHIPISERMKKPAMSEKKLSSSKPKEIKVVRSSFKNTIKSSKTTMKNVKYSKSLKVAPGSGDGQKKWTTLVHNGVIFPPPYQPHGVKMLYKGKPVDITPEQEEVATMYAVMQDTDYMTKPKFKENFWNDWRKLLGKNHVIQNLEDCNFTPIYEWYQKEKEKKKQMSSEEKKALREEKLKQEEKYMWAVVDGVKEKVGNFRVEPPGLFRGRGEHPKMGKLKRRIHPSDITINIGKDAPIPECPIAGERWKEIRHDNTVTWLAYWYDPINPREFKYVFLAASSSLKGQSDKEKYEKARMLKGYIDNIRAAYMKDFVSKDPTKRQIAVATYLIDKLALRAGNEKDDDEADTVGCCTLKVENVMPKPPNKLEFSFLGKDSIKYENVVEVELPVYKAIIQFQAGKSEGDDLFDMLDTSKLNAHLKELMPGLTAKVFRTYNASITLDEMLSRETKDGDVAEKVVVYQHANKEVAIICNHQRAESKSHAAQMTKLNEKINELMSDLKELKTDLDRAKKGKPPLKDADGKQKRNLTPEALEKKMAQTSAKIEKMERDMKTKEDLKKVALGTSKINYLDPRITVAWCKRHEVPIEKIFNRSLIAKFAWAMDVDPDFRF